VRGGAFARLPAPPRDPQISRHWSTRVARDELCAPARPQRVFLSPAAARPGAELPGQQLVREKDEQKRNFFRNRWLLPKCQDAGCRRYASEMLRAG
jgi:hypothetical protein